MSENLLRVQPIRNGTVIDHIKKGRGRKILKILNLSESETTISLLMNVTSKKKKKKDIIKVEDRELSENETEKLALLSPDARINIIRNYAVAEKKKIDIPRIIMGTVYCSNDSCISNNEGGATSKFKLLDSENITIKCIYCRRKIKEDEINFL